MITKTILTITLALVLMIGILAPLALAGNAPDSETGEIGSLDEVPTDTSITNVSDDINYESSDDEPMLISTNTEANLETSDTSVETEEELELNEDVSNSKIAWKHFGLWFTFNQEKIAEKQLELAKLRLAQANWAAKHNNTKAMEKALEAHERIMDKLQNRINKIEYNADDKNVSAPVARLVALETAIAVHERRITFLNNVLENANLTDEQRARVEARISHVEEVTGKLTELNLEKRDKMVTKLMAVKNMTEDEANEVIDNREATIRENVKDRIQNRIEKRAANAEDEVSSEDSNGADELEDSTDSANESEED